MNALSKLVTVILMTLGIFSCMKNVENKQTPMLQGDSISKIIRIKYIVDSLNTGVAKNINFLTDSVFIGKRIFLERYFGMYLNDSCAAIINSNNDLKAYRGISCIGKINGDNIKDSVFIMPPISYCEEGCSYVFTDTTIPRLLLDTYVVSKDRIFSVGDIDEDGISELGIFYSTGMSRYKCIRVYSLKNKEWKEVGLATFDIRTQDSEKVIFKDLVRKIKKSKFEIRTFIDGSKYWQSFEMK